MDIIKTYMKSIILLLSIAIFIACKAKKENNFEQQLKLSFLTRLEKADSSVILDSFLLVKADTLFIKTGMAFDDSMYVFEYRRVQAQYNNASRENRQDSLDYYKGELDYMTKQITQLEQHIRQADSTHGLGILFICRYQIRLGDKTQKDWIFYPIAKDGSIIRPDLIDDRITLSVKNLKKGI